MSGLLDPLTEKEVQAPGWHLVFSGLSRDGSGKGGARGGEGAFSVCQHQCARSASLCGWEGDGVVCVCVCVCVCLCVFVCVVVVGGGG